MATNTAKSPAKPTTHRGGFQYSIPGKCRIITDMVLIVLGEWSINRAVYFILSSNRLRVSEMGISHRTCRR
jgi:hypothetical protein